MKVLDASLSPTTTDKSTSGTKTTDIVGSVFKLDLLMAFQDDIGGDLFSYGEYESDGITPKSGLTTTGYALEMTTTIEADRSDDSRARSLVRSIPTTAAWA